jgi:hypothetical protein
MRCSRNRPRSTTHSWRLCSFRPARRLESAQYTNQSGIANGGVVRFSLHQHASEACLQTACAVRSWEGTHRVDGMAQAGALQAERAADDAKVVLCHLPRKRIMSFCTSHRHPCSQQSCVAALTSDQRQVPHSTKQKPAASQQIEPDPTCTCLGKAAEEALVFTGLGHAATPRFAGRGRLHVHPAQP